MILVAEKRRVLILGGGMAGLMTATHLQKWLKTGEAEVTVVNKHDYHFVTSKLHESGAGNLSDHAVSMDIQKELLDSNKVIFKQDEVISINKDDKIVQLSEEEISYDILVACLGGEPQTFGVPGVAEHGYFIWTRESSQKINQRMIENCKAWHEDQDDSRLTIVCVGAGFTGMEFLGEMVHRRKSLANEYDVPAEKIKIICLEAADQILPSIPKSSVDYGVQLLAKNDIEIRLNQRIDSIDENGIHLADGTTIPSKTIVWATGVTGSTTLAEAGFPTMGRSKRVLINEFLEVDGYPDTFVIGDAGVAMDPEGNPYQPTAQVALQQGTYVARSIVGKVRDGVNPKKPFKLIYRGTMMSLGHTRASGIVYGWAVKGMIGCFFKKVIDLRYYFELKGIRLAIKMFFRK